MLDLLVRLLVSQVGEIATDDPSDDATSTDDTSTGGTASTDDAALETEQAASPDAGDTTQKADHFLGDENLDPTKLDPALQPIFKRMQGAYTKRMQAIAEIREKAEVVDRFYNDRDFATQTLQAWAAQNGYQVVPRDQAAQQQGGSQTPRELVEAFKAKLDPSLHWMAEPQANATWTVMQQLLNPLVTNQQQAQLQSRQSEYDRYANELAASAPGWEEHEDTMSELLDFMGSKDMAHPKFGSKIKILYDIATSRSASLAEATKRVNAAAQNRSSGTRGGARAQGTKVDDLAKSAKSTQEAWDIIRKNVLKNQT